MEAGIYMMEAGIYIDCTDGAGVPSTAPRTFVHWQRSGSAKLRAVLLAERPSSIGYVRGYLHEHDTYPLVTTWVGLSMAGGDTLTLTVTLT